MLRPRRPRFHLPQPSSRRDPDGEALRPLSRSGHTAAVPQTSCLRRSRSLVPAPALAASLQTAGPSTVDFVFARGGFLLDSQRLYRSSYYTISSYGLCGGYPDFDSFPCRRSKSATITLRLPEGVGSPTLVIELHGSTRQGSALRSLSHARRFLQMETVGCLLFSGPGPIKRSANQVLDFR